MYGENLYKSWHSVKEYDKTTTSGVSTRSWYDEKEAYDFDNPGDQPHTSHFTQVVWAASELIGCGVA